MEGIDVNSLPMHVQTRLRQLEREYSEGDITRQGFEKKKNALLADFMEPVRNSARVDPPQISSIHAHEQHSPYMKTSEKYNISPSPVHKSQSFSFNYSSNHNTLPPRASNTDLAERYRTHAVDPYINGRPELHNLPPAIPPQHPGRGMRTNHQMHHPITRPNYTRPPPVNQPNYQASVTPRINYGPPPSYRPHLNQQRPSPVPVYPSPPPPPPPPPTSYYDYGPSPPITSRPLRPPPPNVRPSPRPQILVTQNLTDSFSPRNSGDFPLRNKATEQVRSQIAYEERSRGSLDMMSDTASIKSFVSTTDTRSIYNEELLHPRLQDDNVSIRSNSAPTTNFAFKYGSMNGQNEKLSRSPSRTSHNNRRSQILAPFSSDAPSFDPELSKLAGKQFMPFEPRDVPFPIVDPLNPTHMMATFPNIGAIFRHRGTSNPKRLAFVSLDQKGREVHAWTWEKLHSRAEKVAQQIFKHRTITDGDNVALIYRKSEIMDFLVAFYGCFLAGVVAVPINAADEFYELCFILQNTNARLALTTDHNLKVFTRDLAAQRKELPANVEWWKTNEFGGYNQKKKDDYPPIRTTELAYIEYTKAPNGELKGVAVSHRQIMAQCGVMRGSICEKNARVHMEDVDPVTLVDKQQSDTLLTHLDPRQQIGLLLGALFGVFCGNTTVYLGSLGTDVPGLWVNCISKYKATMALADYPGLQPVVASFKSDPTSTHNYSKKHPADLSTLRFLFIDTFTVDPQRNDEIAEHLLKPLGVRFPYDVVTPVCSLPEHGGMILSFGDLIGVEGVDDRLEGHRQVQEFLIDREALKSNKVVLVAVDQDEVKRRADEKEVARVGAFGFVMPEATIAIVDPETTALCLPNTVGEVWVDSPSFNGEFWELFKLTRSIFHAQPLVVPETTGVPELFEEEFLRTGLLGCLINGLLVVFGLYEDRIRQLAEVQPLEGDELNEVWDFHYTIDLEKTIKKHIQEVNECAAFQSFVNDEFLPVLVVESALESSDLADQIENILLEYHGLRVYCTIVCPVGSLPRTLRNGKKLVNNMLCRKAYDFGKLKPHCVKTSVERTVFNIPMGIDPIGGIWGPAASKDRQISPSGLRHSQYTGIEIPQKVLDDQTGFDLMKFFSIVDILLWRSHITPEVAAFTSLDSRGREGKQTSWKKFSTKIATTVNFLQKKGCQPGDHTVLIFPHGLDYIVTIYASMVLGMTPIPFAPPDIARAKEDVLALSSLCEDFNIPFILVNTETETLLKSKQVQSHLKSDRKYPVKFPPLININKAPKFQKTLKEANYGLQQEWHDPNFPAVVTCYFSADMKRSCVKLGHDTLLAMCKVQKETCRMTSKRAIMSCEKSFSGLGFVHTVLLGVYIGSPTILHTPADYYTNPMVWLENIGHFQIENTYATFPMLHHAMEFFGHIDYRGFSLQNMKNLMIPVEGRPQPELYKKVVRSLHPNRLDDTAISYVYSHVANPMVTTRSYMSVKPFELALELDSLRRGIIKINQNGPENAYEARKNAEGEENMYETKLHDLGMVPVSTRVAIVHPETRRLCQSNEFGEIWVASDANGKALIGSKDRLDRDRFEATIEGDGSQIRYVRTGDLGFLHTVPHPSGDGEFQCLYYLGPIGETFEVNGLMYFYCDVEHTIERWCNDRWPVKLIEGSCCVIFQTKGEVVCVVEVRNTQGMLNLVPAILKIVLDVHQFVLDVIVFLGPDKMPRSRTGEKQRIQVVGGWVQKTLPILHVHRVKQSTQQPDDTSEQTFVSTPTTSVVPLPSNSSDTTRMTSSLASLDISSTSSSTVIATGTAPQSPLSAPSSAHEKTPMKISPETDVVIGASASGHGRTSNLFLDDENWEQVDKVELEEEQRTDHTNLPKMPISAIPEKPPQLSKFDYGYL